MFTIGSKSFQLASLARASKRMTHSQSGQLLDKILIANRGEIACRVVRTARKLGVRTCAVYSEADKNSMHVNMADEGVHIGPAPSTESYLKMDKIIDVAKRTGCKGIHPGYGFLSENAIFANKCKEHGLVFIGPPASAITAMGSKSESKHIMSSSGVPIVKGYHGEDQSLDTLQKAADEIGYPVLIKAVLGGGGKGMRIVHRREDFPDMLESSRHESRKHFADDRVLVEKYISVPRHIEVQVFCDTHGNAVYLFERDCSLQRRHQKVIEEAPAPGLPEAVRKEIGEAAVRAARAVGYVGAGTVEFIVDTTDLKFYFMEMNTRLQVEHPITEMITGTDLVEWQLRVASGQPLPLKQEDLAINGHSFEARIYAENPRGNFLPGSGPLLFMRTPEPAADVRVETGVRQGDEVSIHYDPMIAKLVVWAPDRNQALAKLDAKLAEYNIVGLKTNVDFLRTCAKHPEFVAGNVATNFIEIHKKDLLPENVHVPAAVVAQSALAIVLSEAGEGAGKGDPYSPWSGANSFRVNHAFTRKVPLTVDGKNIVAEVTKNDKKYSIQWAGLSSPIVIEGSFGGDGSQLLAHTDGHFTKNRVAFVDNQVHVFTHEGHFSVERTLPSFLEKGKVIPTGKVILSPMTGTIERVQAKVGDVVKQGDIIVVMEAMKMELVLRAPMSGKISKISAVPGKLVDQSTVLVEFEETK